jgi:hypothetical protein
MRMIPPAQSAAIKAQKANRAKWMNKHEELITQRRSASLQSRKN